MSALPLHLRRLARLYGVGRVYTDALAVRRPASREALMATLRSLGAKVEQDADVEPAIRARLLELWSRPIEPTIVAWDGLLRPIRLRLPADVRGRVDFELQPESFGSRSFSVDVSSLEPIDEQEVDGRFFRAFDVPASERLPTGAHTMTLSTRGLEARSTILSAPLRAFGADGERGRGWGVFAPLYALRGERDFGVGDFTDLERLGHWIAERQDPARVADAYAFVGLLPLLATDYEDPAAASPYTPLSRLFWSETFLDVQALPEFTASDRAKARLAEPDMQAALARRSGSELVDYTETTRLKKELLAILAGEFETSAAAGRRAAFQRFLDETPHARAFAAFRAASDERDAPWPNWPDAANGVPAASDRDVHRHAYMQFAVREQLDRVASNLRAQNVELYLDLALGVHPDGFDAWRFRDLFAQGASTGAPPDPLFTGGQDWGFAPVNPDRSREDGHAYFRASVREQLRVARMLRIDHALGLHRLFFVPEGFSAKEGVYVHFPAEELYAALSIESHRAEARLIGENLGTVPPSTNRALARHGLATMHVLEFAIHASRDPPIDPAPERSLVCFSTHDTAMFAGFWRGLDIGDRVDLGLSTDDQAVEESAARAKMRHALIDHFKRVGMLHQEASERDEHAVLCAFLRHLSESPAEMSMLSLEDLWLEERPQNTPGTTSERINWRRRCRLGLEEILSDPTFARTLEDFQARRSSTLTQPMSR